MGSLTVRVAPQENNAPLGDRLAGEQVEVVAGRGDPGIDVGLGRAKLHCAAEPFHH
jgi:hypothetical protein